MNSLTLDRFKVILVGTKIPENLGSVARLLENYAVGDAALVDPNCEWRTGVAQWMATNSSRDRLNSLPVFATLREAVSECSTVIGFTARAGKTRKSSLKLENLASQVQGKVALVFGREDYCLLKEEIEICTHLCALDTSPEFPALNLSHSVAVVVSQIFNQENTSRRGHYEQATQADLEPFFTHLETTLRTLGYEGEGNPDRVLAKLRKIYQRAGLSRGEIELLRGVCSKTIALKGYRDFSEPNPEPALPRPSQSHSK
jgi:TrmH family RNA methyltransferase